MRQVVAKALRKVAENRQEYQLMKRVYNTSKFKYIKLKDRKD